MLVTQSIEGFSGQLYIGSATGGANLWQRFGEYVRTGGHGGNKLLSEIVSRYAGIADSFQFSILQTMPTTASSAEVVAVETEYKAKLGTRIFGLNAN